MSRPALIAALAVVAVLFGGSFAIGTAISGSDGGDSSPLQAPGPVPDAQASPAISSIDASVASLPALKPEPDATPPPSTSQGPSSGPPSTDSTPPTTPGPPDCGPLGCNPTTEE